MQKALLIAEKPSLMRTIQSVYNKGSYPYTIDFTSFAGHVIRQKEPYEYEDKNWGKPWEFEKLPMVPEKFEYTVAKDKEKMYKDIASKLKSNQYDFIINACDAEREGNHIFQLFYNYSKCKLPIKRFWSNDLTDQSVDKALRNLRYVGDGLQPDLQALTDSAFARAHFDWLVGMNLTVAETLALNAGITARIGRVKSAVLTILGKREEELANFKPKTTYGLVTLYKEGFEGTLFDQNGDVSKEKRSDYNDIINQLGKTANVESVDNKREKTYAPKLYNMTALQHDAGVAFGYDANETLDIAQSLYEKKYLTYPRASCPYISKELVRNYDNMLKAVAVCSGLDTYVQGIKAEDRKRAETSSEYVNDAEVNKASHTALVVTGVKPDWNALSDKEKNIFMLVAKRFLSIFLPPTIADKTTLITNNNGYKFKTNGKTIVDKGYAVLYDTNFKDVTLPVLKKGDVVNVDKFDIKEKVTKPPKRYTDADLVLVMESPAKFLDDESFKDIIKETKGIGTEATRAGIIQELEKNEYIEKKQSKGKAKVIFVTEQGMFLYKNIKDKDFGKVDLTAIWETKLEEIVEKKKTLQEFEQEAINYVVEEINIIKSSSVVGTYKKDGGNSILGKCPACGGNIIIHDNFYGCENYKEENGGCTVSFSKNIFGAKISENEARKIINGTRTKEFNMKNKDKSWTAALMYNPETKKVEFAPREEKALGKCPCCGGNFKATKDYYMCENYRNGCNLIVGKTVYSAKLTDSDIVKILTGEKTRMLKMSKDGKSWETQLMYIPSEKKIGFAPREEIEIGKCPACGGNIKTTKDYYICEHYKEPCQFIVKKDYFGAKITPDDMKKIVAGEKTRTLKMSKDGKSWETQLMYIPSEKKVGFAPREQQESKTIGKCPCCGKNVIATDKYYKCEGYKNDCDFIFSKDMYGAKVSESDAQNILNGGTSKELSMSNNGKKWVTKIYYNPSTKRVEFVPKNK